nr:MAG TPA: hypothetical protein [Caudoviricetes sp.]
MFEKALPPSIDSIDRAASFDYFVDLNFVQNYMP